MNGRVCDTADSTASPLPVADRSIVVTAGNHGQARTLTSGFIATYLSFFGFTWVLVYGPTRSVAACTHTSSTPIGRLPAVSLSMGVLGDAEDSAGALMLTVAVILDTFFNGAF
jgi:hypothetical protein